MSPTLSFPPPLFPNRFVCIVFHAMATIEVLPATFPADREKIVALFTAYAKSLNIDLAFQSFDEELSQLPGKYASEEGGALLLASDPASRIIGCVAIRAFSRPETCELKRLYVVPEARGMGAAQRLMDAVIVKAQELGYTSMLLDTLASMEAARKLYERYGFEQIDKYYDNPVEGTVFMRGDLGHVACVTTTSA